MARRRAVNPEDKVVDPGALPLLYRALAPLAPERHSALRVKETRDYQVASDVNAIPLTVDEFPRAMRDYPIVMARGEVPTPVALVGFEKGRNDFVGADGVWKEGTYIPAYLRRYPFALVREAPDAERVILCADLSSTLFSEKEDEGDLLFQDGKPGPAVERALEFCKRYDIAAQRTRALVKEMIELDLIGPSSVTIERGERKQKVEGFAIVNEEKLWALDDKTLAGLARRGVLNLFAAHQMSMANFASFGNQ